MSADGAWCRHQPSGVQGGRGGAGSPGSAGSGAVSGVTFTTASAVGARAALALGVPVAPAQATPQAVATGQSRRVDEWRHLPQQR